MLSSSESRLSKSSALVVCSIFIGPAAGADPRPIVELPLDKTRPIYDFVRNGWLEFSPDGRWLATYYQPSYERGRFRFSTYPEKGKGVSYESPPADFVIER